MRDGDAIGSTEDMMVNHELRAGDIDPKPSCIPAIELGKERDKGWAVGGHIEEGRVECRPNLPKPGEVPFGGRDPKATVADIRPAKMNGNDGASGGCQIRPGTLEQVTNFLSWGEKSAELICALAPLGCTPAEKSVDIAPGKHVVGSAVQRAKKVALAFFNARKRGIRKRVVQVEQVSADPIGILCNQIVLLGIEVHERVLQQLIAETACQAERRHLYARTALGSLRRRWGAERNPETHRRGAGKQRRVARQHAICMFVGRYRLFWTLHEREYVGQMNSRAKMPWSMLQHCAAERFRADQVAPAHCFD